MQPLELAAIVLLGIFLVGGLGCIFAIAIRVAHLCDVEMAKCAKVKRDSERLRAKIKQERGQKTGF